MTDGLTQGPPDDDKTTAIVVAPRAGDLRPGADGDVRPRVMLLGSDELSRELAIALRPSALVTRPRTANGVSIGVILR